MLPFGLDPTAALAIGDVDGDGDLDAYVGNGASYASEQDRLYINTGAGAFRDASGQLPSTFAASRSVAFGDVDGDGDLDVLLAKDGQNRLGINDGAGTFADATSHLPAILDNTRSVALGDVDGDGDLDVWFGGWSAGVPDRLYLNDGSGSFSDATSQLPTLPPTGQSSTTFAVALGDVDGDGDLDAFLAGATRLYLNDGAGVFTNSTSQLPYSYLTDLAVRLGDLDGDGDLDVVLATYSVYSWENYRIYLNVGAGTFVDASAWFPSTPGLPRSVSLGDVDGDGDLDALYGNLFQDRLFLNDGTAHFTDATFLIPPSPIYEPTNALALADLDGDGDLDALIANGFGFDSSVAQNRLHRNDGSGLFVDVTAPPGFSLHKTRAVALGDVDGDGDLDVRVGNEGQNRLYLNNGCGLLVDATGQLPAISDGTRALALGDIDSDGDLDALIGNDGPNRLEINDGAGTFTSQSFGGGPCDALAMGDVDGDGDLDVVVGRDGQDRLYLNDGAGGFTDATMQVPALDDDTYALAMGDFDGDGDLDVAIGNEGQNGLWINDGTGHFADGTSQLPPDADETVALAAVDVDGDGDLDLLVGNTSTGSGPGAQSRLYLNDGSGAFTDATNQLPAILDHTLAVALGDVDGDGDLDALMGNGISPYYYASVGEQNYLYLNDGSGVFVLATAVLPAVLDDTRAVALGDMDGDGELDAFIGNDGGPYGAQDRLFTNLGRQLAWRAVPGIGKDLILDLYGPSFGGAFLAFSLGTANLSVPPFGTLRLEPTGMNLVLTSLLDAQGRASVAYAVPANPALIGATVYWQALVTSPARFTNLEITTLMNL
jgi:hypothetical protein